MPRLYNKHHGNIPLDAVRIDRSTKWGNPFAIGHDGNRDQVIEKYRKWIRTQHGLVAAAKVELKGKNLVCFCYPLACHGDVLMEIANE